MEPLLVLITAVIVVFSVLILLTSTFVHEFLQKRVRPYKPETPSHSTRNATVFLATGLRDGVPVRMPRDADDFEAASAEWVTRCGVPVNRTAKGPDGGLDLLGLNFAGQCKFHPANKVGAPDIQQLAGAAQQARKQHKAFFHYGPG